MFVYIRALSANQEKRSSALERGKIKFSYFNVFGGLQPIPEQLKRVTFRIFSLRNL